MGMRVPTRCASRPGARQRTACRRPPRLFAGAAEQAWPPRSTLARNPSGRRAGAAGGGEGRKPPGRLDGPAVGGSSKIRPARKPLGAVARARSSRPRCAWTDQAARGRTSSVGTANRIAAPSGAGRVELGGHDATADVEAASASSRRAVPRGAPRRGTGGRKSPASRGVGEDRASARAQTTASCIARCAETRAARGCPDEVDAAGATRRRTPPGPDSGMRGARHPSGSLRSFPRQREGARVWLVTYRAIPTPSGEPGGRPGHRIARRSAKTDGRSVCCPCLTPCSDHR